MYCIINKTNMLDPNNNLRFATEAEAEAKVAEILNNSASADVYTAKLLKQFKATITIDSTPVEAEPAPAE